MCVWVGGVGGYAFTIKKMKIHKRGKNRERKKKKEKKEKTK